MDTANTANSAINGTIFVQSGALEDLNIIYQNVRGLNSKVSDLFNSVCAVAGEFDIYVLSETWLGSGVVNSELFPADFSVVRADRNYQFSRRSRGGGVLVAAMSSLEMSKIDLNFENENVDILCTKIAVNSFKYIYIFAVYIIPSCPVLIYESLFNFLEGLDFIQNKNFILVGDFNISNLYSFYLNGHFDSIISAFQQFLEFCGCDQKNMVQNTHSHILDLVITNMNCTVKRSDLYLVPEDNHHPTLQIDLVLPYTKARELPAQASKYNFRRADLVSLYRSLSNTNWHFLEQFTDADAAVESFYNELYEILNIHVPKCRKKRQYPVWFNSAIIKKLKEKDKLRKRSKSTGDLHTRSQFINIRAQVKIEINYAYRNYLLKLQREINIDTKAFWSFINAKKGAVHIPNKMYYNDNELTNGKDICNAFAEHFDSVYSKDELNDSPVTVNFSNYEQVFVNEVSDGDIIEAVRNLKVGKAVGPDNIPPYLIKGFMDVFLCPFRILFNLSLKNSVFPSFWKRAKVCPIFKKGDRSDVKNYRPVAVLSSPAKVFEAIIYKTIYFSVQNLISIHQHGFMNKRSTTSNLINMTQDISEALNDRCQLDSIYTDFTKAFDRVSHKILVAKLNGEFNFGDRLLRLITSYLNGREQRVTVRGYSSVAFKPSSGVPQGSNLGPLLFLMFINSLTFAITNASYLLFADDLKIYYKVKSINDCYLLQEDLNNIVEWSANNKLHFNISKCAVITYSRGREAVLYDYCMNEVVLSRVTEMLDLGVTFDSKLTFNSHVFKACNRAMKMFGFIVRHTRDFNDPVCIQHLYMSLVRSVLEYASVVWCPSYQCYKYLIEKIQNKMLRYMYYKETRVYDPRGSPTLLRQRYRLPSLEKRRDVQGILYLFKLVHNFIDDPTFFGRVNFNIPAYNTRQQHTFYLDTIALTNAHQNSPLFRMCNGCNRAQSEFDIFGISLGSLKQTLISLL